MNMTVIIPLIVGDMTERLITERRLGTIEDCDERQMVNQIAKCKTMSDINVLLCEYHFLFSDEKDRGRSVVSVDGTQEYVIKLLTERIETDADIIYDALKYG
jgi:hypothetical protein